MTHACRILEMIEWIETQSSQLRRTDFPQEKPRTRNTLLDIRQRSLSDGQDERSHSATDADIPKQAGRITVTNTHVCERHATSAWSMP